MRIKSRIFQTFLVVAVLAIVLIVAAACGKVNTGDKWDPLLPKGSGVEIDNQSNVDRHLDKSTTSATSVKPEYAFARLMDAANTSIGNTVRDFNGILRQSIVSQEDKNGKYTVIRTKAAFNLLKIGESEFSLEVFTLNWNGEKEDVKVSKRQEFLDKTNSGQVEADHGFYYRDEKLLYFQKPNDKGTLPPLYISDIDFSAIYAKMEEYNLTDYAKKVINGLLTNNLSVTVNGNTIKIIEFIGPIIFPMIFGSECEVIVNSDGSKTYNMIANGAKIKEGLVPVLARVPDLLNKFLGKNKDISEIISSVPKLIDAVLKKTTADPDKGLKAITLDDIKNTKFEGFNSVISFTVTSSGQLKSFDVKNDKPDIRTKAIKSSTVKITREHSNSQDVNNNIFINFPDSVKKGFESVETLPELNLGKVNLSLRLDVNSDKDRFFTFDELIFGNLPKSEIIAKKNAIADSLAKKSELVKLYRTLGLINSINGIQNGSLSNQEFLDSVSNAYTNYSLNSTDSAPIKEEMAEYYNVFKSTVSLVRLINNFGSRSIFIAQGYHGFELSIKLDLKLLGKIGKSSAAIELKDTSDQNRILIGLYLIPQGSDTSGTYSEILADLSGIGFPKIRLQYINLEKLIQRTINEKINGFLAQISNKGLIGMVMDMVAAKKQNSATNSQASATSSTSISAEDLKPHQIRLYAETHKDIAGNEVFNFNAISENIISSSDPKAKEKARAYALKLGADRAFEKLAQENSAYLRLATPGSEENKNIVSVLTSIIEDPKTVINFKDSASKVVKLHISSENLSLIFKTLRPLVIKDEKENEKSIQFDIVKGILTNMVDNITIEAGIKGVDGDNNSKFLYENIGATLNLTLKFKDHDMTAAPGALEATKDAVTTAKVGIDKLALFFDLGDEYKRKVQSLREESANGEYNDLFATRQITLDSTIRLALNSDSDQVKDIMDFLRKIDNKDPRRTDGIAYAVSQLEKQLYPDGDDKLALQAKIARDFNFAIQLKLSLKIDVNLLGSQNLTSFNNELQNIQSVFDFTNIFNKIDRKKLLQGARLSLDVDISRDIDKVMENGKWKDVPIWDREENNKPFATIKYDSDTQLGDKTGVLYIDFGSETLPDLKVGVDLMSFINSKIEASLSNSGNNGNISIFNPENDTLVEQESEEKKKEKKSSANVSAILAGLVEAFAGFDFRTREFQIKVADTIASSLFPAIFADNTFGVNDIPKIGAQLGMKYGDTGINIGIKLNINFDTNSQNDGLIVQVGLNDFKIGLSKLKSERLVSEAEAAKYTSFDSLINTFQQLGKGTLPGKQYIAVNTTVDLGVTFGGSGNADKYETYFDTFLAAFRNKLEEQLKKGSLTPRERLILEELKNFDMMLSSSGESTYIGLRVNVVGRVELSGLMGAIKKLDELNKAQITAVSQYEGNINAKFNAFKDLIKSLDVVLSVQLRNTEGSDSPDRQLVLWINGNQNASNYDTDTFGTLYFRLLSNSTTAVGGTLDSKIKFDFNEDNLTVFKKIAYLMQNIPSGLSLSSGVSSLANANTNSIALAPNVGVDTGAFKNVLELLIQKGEMGFESIKDKLTLTNILALVQEISLTQDGIGIMTSKKLVDIIVSFIPGIQGITFPEVQAKINVNVVPPSGGIAGIGIEMNFRDKEHDSDPTSKQLVNVRAQIPSVSIGFVLVEDPAVDPKTEQVESLSVEKQLNKEGINKLISEDFLGTSKYGYADFKDLKSILLSFKLKLDVFAKSPEAARWILTNYIGLDPEKAQSYEYLLLLSENQYLDLDFAVEISLAQIFDSIVNTINDYSFNQLIGKDTETTRDFIKGNLIASVVDSLFDYLNLRISATIVNKDNPSKNYKFIEIAYSGVKVSEGNFIFIQSDIFGLSKGAKLKGAPEKAANYLKSKIKQSLFAKKKADNTTSVNQAYNPKPSMLEIFAKLFSLREVQEGFLSHDVKMFAAKIASGEFRMTVQSSLINMIIKMFEIDIKGIDLERVFKEISVAVKNDPQMREFEFSAFASLTGLTNEGALVSALSGAVSFTNLFVSLSPNPAKIFNSDILYETDAINVLDLNVTSGSSKQFFTFETSVYMAVENDWKDLDWGPSIDFLVSIVKRVAGDNISEAKIANLSKALKTVFLGYQVDSWVNKKTRLQLLVKIDMNDIFRYLEGLDEAQQSVDNRFGNIADTESKEYIDALAEARLAVNLAITYLKVDIKLFSQDLSGSEPEEFVFGLGYDSAAKEGNEVIEALLIYGGEDYLAGSKYYLNLGQFINIPKLISKKIADANKKKLNDYINNEGVENTSTNTNQNGLVSSYLDAKGVVDVITYVADKISKIVLIDTASGTADKASGLKLATTMLEGIELLQLISTNIASMGFINNIVNDIINKDNLRFTRLKLNNQETNNYYYDPNGEYFVEINDTNKGVYQGVLDESWIVKNQNMGDDKNRDYLLSDKIGYLKEIRSTIPKIKTSLDLQFRDEIRFGAKLEFDANPLQLGSHISEYPSFSLGMQGFKLDIQTSDTGSTQITSDFKSLYDLNVKVETSVNMHIKSPLYSFDVSALFSENTDNEILKNLAGTITEVVLGNFKEIQDNGNTVYVKNGIDTYVKLSLQVKLNLGDIFDEEKQAKDYSSEIKVVFDVHGYKNPVVIYTNLNDLYVDASAVNLPKFKLTNLDILRIVRTRIRNNMADKNRKAKLDEINNMIGAGNAGETSNANESNKKKLSALDLVLDVLGGINAVERENGKTDIILSNNLFNIISSSLLGSGNLEEFSDVRVSIKGLRKLGTDKVVGLEIDEIGLNFSKELTALETFNGIPKDPVLGYAVAGGTFNMSVAIGKASSQNGIPTKIALDANTDKYMSAEEANGYIEYQNLIIKLRGEASITFESKGKPYMPIDGILRMLLNKINPYFSGNINSLVELLNVAGVSNADEIANDSISQEAVDDTVSKHSGVYSLSGDSNFTYIFNVSGDLPLGAIIGSEETYNAVKDDFKLQFHFREKFANGMFNTIMKATYSQHDKALYIEMPMLGIKGIAIRNLDILNILRSNESLEQFNSSISLANANTLALAPQDNLKRLTVTIDDKGIKFALNSNFIDAIVTAVLNKTVTDDNANKIKSVIPKISEIALDYQRFGVDNQGNEQEGRAGLFLKVTQTIESNGEHYMSVKIQLELSKTSDDVAVMTYADSSSSDYNANAFFNEPAETKIQYATENMTTVDAQSFDKIDKTNSISIFENLPFKTLDASFDVDISAKLENSYNWDGSPIKAMFELLDKVLLNLQDSESGLDFTEKHYVSDSGGEKLVSTVLNIAKSYNVKIAVHAKLDLSSITAFRDNTRLSIKLIQSHNPDFSNPSVLMDITYVAKEGALYLNLEKLGFMKVRVLGIDFADLLGNMLFRSSLSINYLENQGALSLAADENDFGKPRIEIGFRIAHNNASASAVNGTYGTTRILINDAFIQSILSRMFKANYAKTYYDADKFKDRESATKMLKEVHPIIKKMKFNDIMIKLEIDTKPGEDQTGFKSLGVYINLDEKVNATDPDKAGKLYSDDMDHNVTGDMAVFNSAKNSFRLRVANLKISTFDANTISSDLQVNANEYSSLNIGDVSIIARENKMGLGPVIFNIIQLLTQPTSNGNVLVGAIMNSSKYIDVNGDNISGARTLQLQVSRKADGKVTNGIEVQVLKFDENNVMVTQIVASLLPEEAFVRIHKLHGFSESGGGVNALGPILFAINIPLKDILRSKLSGVFTAKTEVESVTATDPTGDVINEEQGYVEETYKGELNTHPERSIDKLMAIDGEGNKITYLYNAYYYAYTTRIPVDQFIEFKNTKRNGNYHDTYLGFWNNEGKWIKYSNWVTDAEVSRERLAQIMQAVNVNRNNVKYVTFYFYNHGFDYTGLEFKFRKPIPQMPEIYKKNSNNQYILNEEGKKQVDISKIIRSININPVNPKLDFINDGQNINVSAGTLLSVKLNNDFVYGMIKYLNVMLEKMAGPTHMNGLANAPYDYKANDFVIHNSEYLVDVMVNKIVSILINLDGRLMTFSNTIVNIKPALKKVVNALLPLPSIKNYKKVIDAGLDILLSSAANNDSIGVFRGIKASISTAQIAGTTEEPIYMYRETLQIKIANGGIKLERINIDSVVYNVKAKNAMVDDVYNPYSYNKAYNEAIGYQDKTANAKVQNVYGAYNAGNNMKIDVSWIKDPTYTTIVDPLNATNGNSNKIVYKPYVANVAINSQNMVSISIPETAIRKPYVGSDNKLDIKYVERDSNGAIILKDINADILKNILPSQRDEVIDYFRGFKQIAIRMVDHQGNDIPADPKPSNNNNEYRQYKDGHMYYIFGGKGQALSFDFNNLPSTNNDIVKLENDNKYITLTYGSGLTKNVNVKIGFTTASINLDKDVLRVNMQKELVKILDSENVYPNPANWEVDKLAAFAARVYEGDALSLSTNDVAEAKFATFKADKTFYATIQYPLSAMVQKTVVNYDNNSIVLNAADTPKKISLAIYAPPYASVRITYPSIIVTLKYKNAIGQSKTIGTYKFENTYVDLYPPQGVERSGRLSISSNSMSAPIANRLAVNTTAMTSARSLPLAGPTIRQDVAISLKYKFKSFEEILNSKSSAIKDVLYKDGTSINKISTLNMFDEESLKDIILNNSDFNKSALLAWLTVIKIGSNVINLAEDSAYLALTDDDTRETYINDKFKKFLGNDTVLTFEKFFEVVKEGIKFSQSNIDVQKYTIANTTKNYWRFNKVAKYRMKIKEVDIPIIKSAGNKEIKLSVNLNEALGDANPANNNAEFNVVAGKIEITTPDEAWWKNHIYPQTVAEENKKIDYLFTDTIDNIRSAKEDYVDAFADWVKKINGQEISGTNNASKVASIQTKLGIIMTDTVSAYPKSTKDMFAFEFRNDANTLITRVEPNGDQRRYMAFNQIKDLNTEVEVDLRLFLNEFGFNSVDVNTIQDKIEVVITKGKFKVSKTKFKFGGVNGKIELHKLFDPKSDGVEYFVGGAQSRDKLERVMRELFGFADLNLIILSIEEIGLKMGGVANKFDDLAIANNLGNEDQVASIMYPITYDGLKEIRDKESDPIYIAKFRENLEIKKNRINKILAAMGVSIADLNLRVVLDSTNASDAKLVLTKGNIVRFMNIGQKLNVPYELKWSNDKINTFADLTGISAIGFEINVSKKEFVFFAEAESKGKLGIPYGDDNLNIKLTRTGSTNVDGLAPAIKVLTVGVGAISKDMFGHYSVGSYPLVESIRYFTKDDKKIATGELDSTCYDIRYFDSKEKFDAYEKAQTAEDMANTLMESKLINDIRFKVNKASLKINVAVQNDGSKNVIPVEYGVRKPTITAIVEQFGFIKLEIAIANDYSIDSKAISELEIGDYLIYKKGNVNLFAPLITISEQFIKEDDDPTEGKIRKSDVEAFIINSFETDFANEDDIYLKVQHRRISVEYKNVNIEYNSDIISIKDIMIVRDTNGNDITDKFIQDLLYPLDLVTFELKDANKKNEKLMFNIDSKDTEITFKDFRALFSYKKLGAGAHSIYFVGSDSLKYKPESENSKFGSKDNNAKVNVNKKPLSFEIVDGYKKNYGQEVDQDLIKIILYVKDSNGNFVKETKALPALVGDEKLGAKYKELKPDTRGDLGITFQWNEIVGIQEIRIASVISDNYDIAIDEVTERNKNKKITINKTYITLQFPKSGFTKLVSKEDPMIDPMELLIQPEEGKETDYFYEVEIPPTAFEGNITRVAGEKKGEYHYSIGTLKVDESRYILRIIRSDCDYLKKGFTDKDIIANFVDDPNAKLHIQEDKKISNLPPAKMTLLLIFVAAIGIGIFVLGVFIKRKANKNKFNSKGGK